MPRQEPTTVAILGANAIVENALAQLLEGEGYATRVLKPFPPMGEALKGEEMPLGDVDVVVLAPGLSTSECEAFLAARRRQTTQKRPTTQHSPIPVILLTSPMREAPPLLVEEEEAARSVPWPTTPERLVAEIEQVLLEARFPARRQRRASRRREDGIHR